jgi:hypothetical protein
MATHMKTTVDISDPLMSQVKALARKQNTTVRALIERGLRLALAERKAQAQFKLRDASVSGTGQHPDAAKLPWEQIRNRIYEGHGA